MTHCVTDFSTNSSRNNATCKPGGSDPLAISISDGAEFFSLVWPKKKKKKIANKIQQKKEEKKMPYLIVAGAPFACSPSVYV